MKAIPLELRVINFLAKIFRHKHTFVNTHFNKWGIPTRRECECGYSEEQRHPPKNFGDDYTWYPESQKNL